MSDPIDHPGKIMLDQLDLNMASLQAHIDGDEKEALEIYSRLLIEELLEFAQTTDVHKALDRVFNSQNPIMPSSPLVESLTYYQQLSQRAHRNEGDLFLRAFNRELALRGENFVLARPHHSWFIVTKKKEA